MRKEKNSEKKEEEMGRGGRIESSIFSLETHHFKHSTTFFQGFFWYGDIFCPLSGSKKHAMESKLGGLTQEAKENLYANF